MYTFAPLPQSLQYRNSRVASSQYLTKARDTKAFQQTQKTRGVDPPANEVEEEYVDVSENIKAALQSAREQWDNIDNKSTLAVYAIGFVSVIWLSSTIIGAVNKVPVLPQLMEFVGLTYTAWFIYRYLLFKSNREELLEDVENLKKKVKGD